MDSVSRDEVALTEATRELSVWPRARRGTRCAYDTHPPFTGIHPYLEKQVSG